MLVIVFEVSDRVEQLEKRIQKLETKENDSQNKIL